MFNQINLRLRASLLLSLLFAIPLIASQYLLHQTVLAQEYLLYSHILCFAVWWYCHRRYASLEAPNAITELRWSGQCLLLSDRAGNQHETEYAEPTLIHPLVCLIRFKLTAPCQIGRLTLPRYRLVALFQCNTIDQGSFRRLRVALLHNLNNLTHRPGKDTF